MLKQDVHAVFTNTVCRFLLVFERNPNTLPALRTFSCVCVGQLEKSWCQKKENHLMEEKKKKKPEEKTDVTQKKVRQNLWHRVTPCLRVLKIEEHDLMSVCAVMATLRSRCTQRILLVLFGLPALLKTFSLITYSHEITATPTLCDD